MISAPVRKPPSPLQIAGTGSARQLAEDVRNSRAVLVADPAVADRAEGLKHGGFLWVEAAAFPVTVAAASGLARRLEQSGVERVLSVGGGSTMDFAKLAVSMVADPLVAPALERGGSTAGVVVLPRPLGNHIGFCAIPTTFGTGSEVNAAACYESGGRENDGTRPAPTKNLVLLEGLATSAVAYDPDFLDAPPWLSAEGLLEPVVRLLTSLVEAKSGLDYSEAQGRWLLAAAGNNLAAGRENNFRLSGQARVDAALLSAESHAGWSLRGRGPAPSSLWFLANELSMALGLRKNQASALLLGPWLDAVGAGNAVWGSRPKLAELWPLVSADGAGAGAAALLGPDHGRPPGRTPPPGSGSAAGMADQLAARTLRRFGGGRPMKRDLGHAELSAMFAAAIRAASAQEPGI
ncbi:MAG: hypothetical protein JWQ75_794 [Pseudarthrobacter sp.]|nr:hypothetical protein [Pseudarthrobacter sp.]